MALRLNLEGELFAPRFTRLWGKPYNLPYMKRNEKRFRITGLFLWIMVAPCPNSFKGALGTAFF